MSNGGSFCCFLDGLGNFIRNLHKNVQREISTVNYGNVYKLQRPGLCNCCCRYLKFHDTIRDFHAFPSIRVPLPLLVLIHQPPIEGLEFIMFTVTSLSPIRGSFLPFICDWILQMHLKGLCICLPCQPVTRDNKGQGTPCLSHRISPLFDGARERVVYCRDFNLFPVFCLLGCLRRIPFTLPIQLKEPRSKSSCTPFQSQEQAICQRRNTK